MSPANKFNMNASYDYGNANSGGAGFKTFSTSFSGVRNYNINLIKYRFSLKLISRKKE